MIAQTKTRMLRVTIIGYLEKIFDEILLRPRFGFKIVVNDRSLKTSLKIVVKKIFAKKSSLKRDTSWNFQ